MRRILGRCRRLLANSRLTPILLGIDAADVRVRSSYSQCGEDRILRYVFNALRIPRPSYLEIGAYDPVDLSNTYHFYEQGSRGVCVEPNPARIETFAKLRPGDICLNVGVGPQAYPGRPFYVMDADYLSTFSKEEAERMCSEEGHAIKSIEHIAIMTVGDIIRQHMPSTPDLISVDVEGLDFEILQSIDFGTIRPAAVCVETLVYSRNGREQKRAEFNTVMEAAGYFPYADTYINTIYVDQERWQNRSDRIEDLTSVARVG
jgi:FkbM family methyltransferase